MSTLKRQKLHVTIDQELLDQSALTPRCYTLTHSDRTGDMFLKIGRTYDQEAISGWYTQLMRDEVLGEWHDDGEPSLHIHCHVSGGLVLGTAKWRDSIFRGHLPMAIQAVCTGDMPFLMEESRLQLAPVMVHFHAKQKKLDRVENWGKGEDYFITENPTKHSKHNEQT